MWVEFPHWLWPVKSFPKGYKWTDEGVIKFHQKSGDRAESFTIWLYPINDDLYYKTTFGIIVGYRSPFSMAYIKDFKILSPNVVKLYFDGFNGAVRSGGDYLFKVLGDEILKLYKSLEIYIGFQENPLDEVTAFRNAHPDHKRDTNDTKEEADDGHS